MNRGLAIRRMDRDHLDGGMRDDMVLRLDSGWSLKAIAAFFGVSVDEVIVMITRKTRPETIAKKQVTNISAGSNEVSDDKRSGNDQHQDQ